MGVTQFIVEMENAPGTLAEISHRVGYAGINIRGISLVASGKTAVLHLVVNDPVATERVMKEAGIEYREDRVLALELPNVPGSLAECAKAIGEAGINIEYLYPFISRTPNAIVIIKPDKMPETEEILEGMKIKMLTEEALYILE